MYGRYVTPSDRAIEDYLHIRARNSGGWVQSFNGAPTTQVPILRLDQQGELQLMAMSLLAVARESRSGLGAL
ncbi:hypothetical protein IPC1040_32510 [Pseudomonas aeruginosa]|jgi:hypothetical protein|nr:hypothetical protein IPC1040_32510 [Pseudomonas aeruginosa]